MSAKVLLMFMSIGDSNIFLAQNGNFRHPAVSTNSVSGSKRALTDHDIMVSSGIKRGLFPRHFSFFSQFTSLEHTSITKSIEPKYYRQTRFTVFQPRKSTMSLFAGPPAPKSALGRYRMLSPTASVRVSPLCLGTMNFGDAWKDFMGECNKQTTEEILDYFYGMHQSPLFWILSLTYFNR